MATPVRSKTAPAAGVMLGDLGMYTSGGGLPEGDYVWKDLTVQMRQAADQNGVAKGPARLTCTITMVPLAGGEERQQHYSLGSKAHESFMPNPETGKGVVPVPGGPASTFNASTNWAILVKSLYDCGLPQGIFGDDVSVLEGLHCHMGNTAEPPERAGFQSNTGEAAADRKPGFIAICTEIKDDGKPWEGTGGLPDVAPAKVGAQKPVPNRAGPKAVAAPTRAAAPAPVAVEEGEEDENIKAAAEAGVAVVLSKNEKGCPKLILRTGTFKAVNEASGQEVASAVISTYFSSDVQLNALLGPLGYKVTGTQITEA